MTTVQSTSRQDIFAPISKDLDRVVDVITQLSIEEIEALPCGFRRTRHSRRTSGACDGDAG